jgi:TonB family protein
MKIFIIQIIKPYKSYNLGGDIMKNIISFLFVLVIFFGCSSTQMFQPVLREYVEPVYPYEAKANGVEGSVDIVLAINELGDVTSTKIMKSSGSKTLDDASIDYSKRLKFEPLSLGRSLPVFVKWTINYKLEGVDVKNGKIKVLAFSKTDGYRHESIDAGKAALLKLANENNFEINFSDDSSVFNPGNLQQYNVIIFLNTSGNILDESGKKAFRKYIENKGGFVGIHNAVDTERNWDWYRELIGTYYDGSEEVELQKAIVRVTEKNHPSTRDLPYQWEVEDEWHLFANKLADNIKVLAVVDDVKPQEGEEVEYRPFCWYHDFDGGRCWYTAGGHRNENYSDPLFMKHILGGIKYAAGVE